MEVYFHTFFLFASLLGYSERILSRNLFLELAFNCYHIAGSRSAYMIISRKDLSNYTTVSLRDHLCRCSPLSTVSTSAQPHGGYLRVCIRAHDRSCWSMTTPYQPRSPLKNPTRRGIAWACQPFQLGRIACSGCYQADSTVCVRLLEEAGSR